MPEVPVHALRLQKYINLYQEAEEDETRAVYEFILTQLFNVANLLDYSDEVGRRHMFTLMRMR